MIPKIIIQTWKTCQLNNIFAENQRKVRGLNPDYKYIFFDDVGVDEFVKQKFPEYWDFFSRLADRIEQIDVFRYLAIYNYGGFYLDMDMDLRSSLDTLCNNSCVFSVEKEASDPILMRLGCNKLLANFMFGACIGNGFIKHIIDCIVQGKLFKGLSNGESKCLSGFQRVFYTAGPVAVTYAYQIYPIKNLVTVMNLPDGFKKYAVHQYLGTWKRDWFKKRFPQLNIDEEVKKRLKYFHQKGREKDC